MIVEHVVKSDLIQSALLPLPTPDDDDDDYKILS
jgi:hypothetical protein